ncbi:MAG: hypothetical protein Q7U57_18185 [Methylovulum sp.]|nr:hypothetical protein [Methylovulum sp.]
MSINTAPSFTFNGDGKVITDISGFYDLGFSVRVQTDGKILVGGISLGYNDTQAFVVTRYNSDGSLDTSFDGDGIASTFVGGYGFFGFLGGQIVLQSDGKIVQAGTVYTDNITYYDFGVVRYNPDGSLDNSFGVNGIVTTNINYYDYATSITLQADGKILVTGFSDTVNSYDFTLLRYNSDGSLDTGFDGDGIVTTDFSSSYDQALSVTTQADGKILLAGEIYNGSSYDFGLARYNSDGSLDTSFDGDGKVTTDFNTFEDWAYSITIQADGKILAAGHTYTGSGSEFALARYNVDGSLDTGFDGDGKVTTDFGFSDNYGYSVTIQADGKILVAGYIYDGGNSIEFGLARYNSDGSLDTSFDGDGLVSATLGNYEDVGLSVTVQADGKILVAGATVANNYYGYGYDFGLVRFNNDGSLDKTFDTHSTTANLNEAAYSVTLQADGKYIVAGYSQTASNKDFALMRFNSNGLLDTSFGDAGKITTALGAYDDVGRSVTVQADGKILVAGYSDNGNNLDFALVRYNSDGSLDTSFDGDGKVTTATGNTYDDGYSVTVQADGKILVAGVSNNGNNEDFALVRYNSDGSLDTSFAGDGTTTTDFGASSDFAYAVTVQTDGKILVSGSSTTAGFALARYNVDGSLDTSFDGDGKVTNTLGVFSARGYAVTLQADGKIVMVGETLNGSDSDVALVRYNTDGSLDTSFGGDGIVNTVLGTSYDYARSVTLQTDGKILVAGYSDNAGSVDFALARYNSDGSLDTSFDGDGKVTTDFHSSNDYGYCVTVQTDGKIVVAGYSKDGVENSFALARYNSDGSLDNTFNSVAHYVASGQAVVINSQAKIYDFELVTQGQYSGASITLVRHGGANSDDVFSGSGNLSFIGSDAVLSGITIGTISNHNGWLTLYFNSNATQGVVDETLSSLTYSNNTYSPSPATVQIDWLFSDGNNGSQGTGGALMASDSTVISILPTDGSPTLAAPAAIHYVDTAFDDNFLAASGLLTATGADSGSFSYGIAGGTDNGNGTVSMQGAYGVLTVTQASGAYQFIPSDATIEPLSADVSASFTVTVTNGVLTDSEALTVAISQSGSTESEGKDTLFGTSGNNTIDGLAGNDWLNGAGGNDVLLGGAGNDLINGGNGNDTLTGGAGKDKFVFNSSLTANVDSIIDFNPVKDTIMLDNNTFSALVATGQLNSDNFVVATAALDNNDYIVYNSATGELFYDANGNSAGAATQIALLGIDLALTHADFIVM